MNTAKLKSFAPEARNALLEAVQAKALRLGVAKGKEPVPATVQGDVAIIAGAPYPRATLTLRDKLAEKIKKHGFDAVMEEAAYTWFNRLMAIRYMEVHGYFAHGLRVLSDPAGGPVPEVLQQAQNVEIPGLDKARVTKLLLEGGKQEELFQTLLIAQCHALGQAMPFLFDTIDSSTELLLPDNLLAPNSIVRKVVSEVPEEDWRTTEILGWLYQFYVSDEKKRVDDYVKKGQAVQVEDIPAKTQLFTPNWIVQFLTQNSLGRLWMDVYPTSPLREKMPYYTPPAEQESEVAAKLREITPDSLDPNTLTAIDPAAGSGHILLELYNLFFAMYQEQGYMPQDIPRRILEQNLFGLELDRRAAQIAGFAVLMRARADDPRLLENPPTVNVVAIQHSRDLDLATLLTPRQAEELFPSERLFESDQPRLTASGRLLFTDGAMVKAMKEVFDEADIVGSLQRIPEEVAAKLEAFSAEVERVRRDANLIEDEQLALLAGLVRQAKVLARRYTTCVANPPYLGVRQMSSELRTSLELEYERTKSSLDAAFLERSLDFAEIRGIAALITMHSWMFNISYEEWRKTVLDELTIETLAHLGSGAFRELSGEVVQTVAQVVRRFACSQYRGSYQRLVDLSEDEKRSALASRASKLYQIQQSDLKLIEGWPIAYWLNQDAVRAFQNGMPLEGIAPVRQGFQTGDNSRYVRFWYEVSWHSCKLDARNKEEVWSQGCKWVPYNKGGGFRKWFGNNEYVVAFDKSNYEALAVSGNCLPSRHLYFRESVTWSSISTGDFGVRYCPHGYTFSSGGACAFPSSDDAFLVLGILNSSFAGQIFEVLSATQNFNVGSIRKFPFPTVPSLTHRHAEAISRLIELSRIDWNLRETSWDFQVHSLVSLEGHGNVKDDFNVLKEKSAAHQEEFLMLSALNDEEVARIYSTKPPSRKTFGFVPHLTGMPSLVSYALGCMMGRYSLDEPCLIYAHSGGEEFDPSRYRTFPADEDGILPLTDEAFFGDQDTAERFSQWVATVWPNSPLNENLAFIAENLFASSGGKKPDETPLEAIRRYLVDDFYGDHLQTYKKRPIYWLFSSGKKRAFQALVYLHRYHPGTLGRMRSHYVQPLIGKLQAQLQQAEASADAASSASEKVRRQREAKKLREQYDELLGFDERLHHYALQAIALDLDDGVKVNYGKFSDPKVGDILAKVKEITGGKNE